MTESLASFILASFIGEDRMTTSFMTSSLRRKINDSYIGQKINHTIPGIRVEGASRTVSDFFKRLKYAAIDGLANGFATITHGRTAMKSYAMKSYFDDVAREMDPSKHYSHNSPIYRQIIKDEELRTMVRIPIAYALHPDLKPKTEEVCRSD